MATRKEFKPGMIITYNGAETTGVIVAITEGGAPILYNPSNKETNPCWNPLLVKILNENYVGSFMTPDQIFNDWFNQALSTIHQIDALKKVLSAIKPTVKTKHFYFGGLYSTDVLVLTVKEENGMIVFLVGCFVLSKVSLQELDGRINTTIAGMKLNPDTLKWGTAIGYVKDIQEAIDYYTSLK